MVFRKKKTFRSQKREVRLNTRRMLVSGGVACLILLLGVGVWYGARRPEVTISSIQVKGGETVSHDIIKSRAESLLAGSYALLIPRSFSYGFPREEIIESINAVPRVHNAAVERSARNELTVTFDEYVPYALWCDAVEDASTTPTCIFVDDTGYAYADAPSLLGESLVRFVIEGRTPEEGVYVYDQETLRHYRLLAEAITESHDHRLRLITETKEGDLILHLRNGTNILMTKDANIDDIFAHIESIFQSNEFKSMKLDAFEYIDLRFGNKVYVKERGYAPEAASAEVEGGSEAVARQSSQNEEDRDATLSEAE